MKKLTRYIITLTPVASMLTIGIVSLLSEFADTEGYWIAVQVLSNIFGYGILWLPAYYYMHRVYHLCHYTKIALHGLVGYSLINITYAVCPILNQSNYFKLFESVFLIAAGLSVTIAIFKHLIEKWNRQN